MEAPPRMPYLDVVAPKDALRAYHTERADHFHDLLVEHGTFLLDDAALRGHVTPTMFTEMLAEARWEDGSVLAIWRDQLDFHVRCLEYLSQ